MREFGDKWPQAADPERFDRGLSAILYRFNGLTRESPVVKKFVRNHPGESLQRILDLVYVELKGRAPDGTELKKIEVPGVDQGVVDSWRYKGGSIHGLVVQQITGWDREGYRRELYGVYDLIETSLEYYDGDTSHVVGSLFESRKTPLIVSMFAHLDGHIK